VDRAANDLDVRDREADEVDADAVAVPGRALHGLFAVDVDPVEADVVVAVGGGDADAAFRTGQAVGVRDDHVSLGAGGRLEDQPPRRVRRPRTSGERQVEGVVRRRRGLVPPRD
jgi:hypothetical protein